MDTIHNRLLGTIFIPSLHSVKGGWVDVGMGGWGKLGDGGMGWMGWMGGWMDGEELNMINVINTRSR